MTVTGLQLYRQTQEKAQHLEAQSIKYKLKKLSRNMNIQILGIYMLVFLKNAGLSYIVQVGGCPILSKNFQIHLIKI